MRVYGEIAQRNDYMLRNSVIFALFSEKKKGPKLYGMYPEGRIEEYIPVNIHIFYKFFHLSWFAQFFSLMYYRQQWLCLSA